MKKRIPFGVWEPDSNAVGGMGRLSEAINVVPVKGGYQAINGASPMDATGGAFTTTPIAASSVIFAFSAFDPNPDLGVANLTPNVEYIAAGSAIYAFTNNQPSTAPIVTGDAAATTRRDMAQYNNQIYLVCGLAGGLGTAPICSADVTNYADDFTTIGSGIQANSVCVLRDFVVVGGTYDSADQAKPNRVRWSAFGDGTSWTPSAATQSDFQDLNASTGEIQRLLGGDDVFVICRHAVVLMQYVGGATIMRFDYIHQFGTQYYKSCVRVNDYAYFYSEAGFVRIGKQKGDVAYIGKGRVDREFNRLIKEAIDSQSQFQPVAYHDEQNGGIGWLYSATSGNAFFYNYITDQWTVHGNGERDGAAYVYASAMSYGKDGYSNSILKRQKTAAWIGSDTRLYVQNDEIQKAKIKVSTGYEELSPGRKAVVDKVWPVQDVRGGSQTNPELVVTSIPRLNGVNLYAEPTSTYSSTASLQSDGFFTVTGPGSYEGKFHRFQLENSDTASERAGEQAILGIDVEFFERGNY